MSLEGLRIVLEGVVADVRKIPASSPPAQHPDIEFPTEITEKVQSQIESTSELKQIANCSLRLISSGGSIGPTHLARAILEHLSLGVDPNGIIASLLDLAKTGVARAFYLAGVAGIKLDTPIEFEKNVTLIPEGNLPPSGAKEAVFRLDRFGRIGGSIGHEVPRPGAALRIDSEERVLIPPKTSYAANLKMEKVREIESRCLACLTLASDGAAPTFTAKTSWLDHPAQPYHGLAGYACGTSPAQQYPLSQKSFVGPLTKDLFLGMKKLNRALELNLLLAINRLCRSRLHAEDVDRAIDLGIALEIILLHGIDHQQELSHRSSMHGALFLETEPKKRRDVFNKLRDAYTARSKAVHEGRLENKQVAALAPADEILRRVIIRIIQDRRFPDWKEIILGAT